MAYNPSPRVAVVRDAARKLAADRAVLVYTTPDGQFGYVSYGETAALCKSARQLGDVLFEATETWLADGGGDE